MSAHYENDVDPRPKRQFDWGRVAELVVPLMIVWAFYTTFQGVVQFQRSGDQTINSDWSTYIGYFGAFIGTLMIVTPMALTSWLLGGDLAARMTSKKGAKPAQWGRTLLALAIFSVVFSFSVFFSYNYYANERSASKTVKMQSQEQLEDMRNYIMSPLLDKVKSVYGADAQALLVEPGVTDYVGFVNKLLNAIQGDQGQAFQRAIEAHDKQVVALQAEIQQAQTELTGLQEEIKRFNDKIDELNKDIIKQNSAAAGESTGIGVKQAGRGPKWQAAIDARTKDQNEIQSIRKELGELKLADGKTTVQARINELNASIKTGRDQLAKIAPSGASSSKPSVLTSDAISQLSNTMRDFSGDPRWGIVQGGEGACLQIVASIKSLGADVLKVPEPVVCVPADAQARGDLQKREERFKAETAYLQKCGETSSGEGSLMKKIADFRQDLRTKLDDRNSTVSESAAAAGALDSTRSALLDCVNEANAVGVPTQSIDEARRNANLYYEDNNPDKDRIQLAIGNLRKGRPDAWLALMYALAQDLFILILKMLADVFGAEAPANAARVAAALDLADRDGDPDDLRARKALVREAVPIRGGYSRLDLGKEPLLDLPAAVRSLLAALLNRELRYGGGRQTGNGQFEISNDVVAKFEEELEQAQGDFSDTGNRAPPNYNNSETSDRPKQPTRKDARDDNLASRQNAGRRGSTFWDRYTRPS